MVIFLATERFALRELTSDDADSVLALDSDPDVMRYVNGGRPTSREVVDRQTLPRLMQPYPWPANRGFWAAEESDAGTFLGWFEFRPLDGASASTVELGYRLNKVAWGRGIATEGSLALIDKGFTELGVEQVTANTMAVNAGSRRVMEKCGLSLVRTFIGDWPDKIAGSEHGEVEYVITRTEWERRRRRVAEAKHLDPRGRDSR